MMTITTTAAMAINWLLRLPLGWEDVLREDLGLLVDLLREDLRELDVLLRDVLLLDRLLDDLRVLDFLVTFPPLDGFRRFLIAQGIGAGWRSFGVDGR